eukprot:TRINITY_DN21602_c0_g1_i1.p1 TRINITY_DN21602_c0_g1~~TRINITY_DN21602_c0_g1_i1.p1  ORF type:complete len:133 (-),score=7.89 TRINITY_DN21602_c0_g1_i1:66-464(-)
MYRSFTGKKTEELSYFQHGRNHLQVVTTLGHFVCIESYGTPHITNSSKQLDDEDHCETTRRHHTVTYCPAFCMTGTVSSPQTSSSEQCLLCRITTGSYMFKKYSQLTPSAAFPYSYSAMAAATQVAPALHGA